MASVPSQIDVAVIGAGLGSLTCAVELARQGLAVRVFEQHRVPGGYAHTFKRRGYTFDVSLHHIGGLDPGAMTHGILQSQGVLDKLRLHRRQSLFRAELPDLTVVLPNGAQEVVEELSRLFPGERAGIERLFRFLPELKADVIGPTMDPEFDVPLADRLTSQYLDHTFGDLLSTHVSDPRLITLLGQLWMYLGLPPSRSTATFTTCVFCSTFLEGAHHIRGGGQALSGALVERLRELGGECLTRTKVTRVLVEDRAAVGLELEGGEAVRAQAVVSGANPFQTFFELVPEAAISRVFRHRISRMEPSLSVYSLYLGLDRRPSELGIEQDNFFFDHGTDLDEAYRRTLEHEIDRTDWCLTSYESSDPGLAPEGGGVLSVAEVTPARDWLELDGETYRQRKDEVRRRLLAKVLRRFPELEGHVKVEEFATPRTMKRYTSNHGGAIYGLAQTVEQSNSRRLRNRTPLPGLFLTGAWTWAGGGYEGAMMTGVQSAFAVLDHLGALRRAPPMRLHPPQQREEKRARTRGRLPESTSLSAEPMLLSHEVESTDGLRDRVVVRVFGSDLGAQWVTGPSAYLRYMDRGRVELIESLCQQTGEESWLSRYTINVYRLDAVFTAISRFGDRLEVQTGLRRASSHRAAFDQRVVNADSRELLVDAVVEVLFLDREGQLATVPASLSRQLGPVSPGQRRPIRYPPVRAEERYSYKVPFRVYYEDTDAQNIAYHASYARYAEGALVESILNVLPPEAVSEWLDPNRIHLSRLGIRFLRAARLGDHLEVQIRGRQDIPGEVMVEQQIVHLDTDQVAAQVVMEVGFVDQEGRRQRVPEPLQNLVPYLPKG